MGVAGPNEESRESATSASPNYRERAFVRLAPPGFEEVPEAATGRRASERLPMSTRNGTSSKADPQR